MRGFQWKSLAVDGQRSDDDLAAFKRGGRKDVARGERLDKRPPEFSGGPAALGAAVGLMYAASPEVLLGPLRLPKKKRAASVRSAFSAWRAHEYGKSIRENRNQEELRLTGRTRGARAWLNLSTAARNQQWQAALSPNNRLHSHRPFIAPGDKWT